ncbi:MAG: hypothetical protein EPO06_12000 [Burkholderiaceae bacterium]|nr:MAG: hypothetical protein EPO06_12000 [Burkholderiaceae bacterium]
MLIGLVGSVLGLPVVQQPHWSARTRWWVTVGFCAAAALLSTALSGQLDGVDWHSARSVATAFVVVLGAATATYKGLGKGFGVAPMVERLTSPPAPGRHRRRY